MPERRRSINAVSGLIPLADWPHRDDGQQIQGLLRTDRAAAGIGRTFQHAELFPDQTVITNVVTGGFGIARRPCCRTSSAHLPSCAAEAAAPFAKPRNARGVRAACTLRDAPTGDLPFGILKRVDLARALLAGRAC